MHGLVRLPLLLAEVLEHRSMDRNTTCVRVKAGQIGYARDRFGFRNIAHRATVCQQVAGGDVDSIEILQRGMLARQDLDRSNLGAILQDVADCNLSELANLTTLQRDFLLRVKAELIEEPDGLSNGSVDDGLARFHARVQDTHKNRKDTDQAHEHRTNPGHQLVHLAHGIRQLPEYHRDHLQEAVADSQNGFANAVKRFRNATEHLQEGSKELIDGIQNEARLVLERLHGTASEVAGYIHAHQACKGHVQRVTALLNPVRFEFIQARQDPKLCRNQERDNRRHHKDDEVHCHENGLIPAQENRFGGQNGVHVVDRTQAAREGEADQAVLHHASCPAH